MRTIVASKDLCWDSIAYETFRDEFYFEQIMQANWRLSDVISFEGGESVIIPDYIEVDNNIIASPWNSSNAVSIIKAPWG